MGNSQSNEISEDYSKFIEEQKKIIETQQNQINHLTKLNQRLINGLNQLFLYCVNQSFMLSMVVVKLYLSQLHGSAFLDFSWLYVALMLGQPISLTSGLPRHTKSSM